jgi:hypothetical protein
MGDILLFTSCNIVIRNAHTFLSGNHLLALEQTKVGKKVGRKGDHSNANHIRDCLWDNCPVYDIPSGHTSGR